MRLLSCLALAALLVPNAYGHPGLSRSSRGGPAARPHSLRRPVAVKRQDQDLGTAGCEPGNTSSDVQAPLRNIFAGLSSREYADVAAFLHSREELNLTAVANATAWDNVIITLDVLPPNKTEALDYLDGSGPIPPRYAKATLQFGATEEPYLQEYMVGPIVSSGSGPGNGTYPAGTGAESGNATSGMRVEELNYIFTTGSGRTRIYNIDEIEIATFNLQVGAEIADITTELLNGTATGEDTDTLLIAGSDPLIHSGDRVYQWNEFYSAHTGNFFSETILPTSLQFKIDITGRDPSQWSVVGWYYNGGYWPTLEEFRAALNGTRVSRPGPVVDGPWTSTDQAGDVAPRDESSPPVPVQPDGPRFVVDREEGWVQWMDFSFFISSHRDIGLQLHDIRFRDERIVYEVGLNEALAHYASQDPLHASSAYLDTSYGIGTSSWNLIDGFDCPAHATFLNTSFFINENTHTHPNSLCLFEQDRGHALQRHLTGTYVQATKNIVFIVRSVATVGNYDYLFEYVFARDGSIEVTVRASGYIQGAFWSGEESGAYGFHIYDNLSGSMHDHVINYKLDMDIMGRANSVMRTDFVPSTEVYPWSEGQSINTMRLEHSFLSSEDEGQIRWGENSAATYAVVNRDSPNQYGEFPGYRILPHAGSLPYLTVQRSTALGDALNWASHNLFALQHHDTEPRSAYPYNSYDPQRPSVDFHAFFNGESLEQEDIVMYFNLGMHHAPNTADLPNTVTTTAVSGILLAPQNYFPGDVSRSTVQQVRLGFDETSTVTETELFGQNQPTCQFDMGLVRPELDVWVGEIIVPKFPWNPSGSMQTAPGGG